MITHFFFFGEKMLLHVIQVTILPKKMGNYKGDLIKPKGRLPYM